jgi:hypothetical protein
MAGAIEITFPALLAECSDIVLPIDDDAVKADLDSYGASFKRTRADLLAGLVLLHAHHADLGLVSRRLSYGQIQRLADALGLDFAAVGAPGDWDIPLQGQTSSRVPSCSTRATPTSARRCTGCRSVKHSIRPTP